MCYFCYVIVTYKNQALIDMIVLKVFIILSVVLSNTLSAFKIKLIMVLAFLILWINFFFSYSL